MYATMLMAALVTGAETPTWGYGGYGYGCYSSYSYYGGCYPSYGYGSYGYGSYSYYPYASSYYPYAYSCYPYSYYPQTAAVPAVQPVEAVPKVTVEPVEKTPGNGFVAPKPQDPSLTPSTDEEKEAVRKLLDSIRKKADAPPPNAARIIVRLPADARLYIDNMLCPLGTGTRAFNTPTLEPRREYFYTLRMEGNRGGQKVSDSRRVTLSAGKLVEVDFGATATAAR